MSNVVTFADLFSQGTLVDLTVGVWAGLLRVRPEDLGIERTAAVAKALTFGHERLVAKNFLDPIRRQETEARQAVTAFSIAFPLISGSRYVPKARRERLDARLQEIKAQFDAEVEKFVEDYDSHKTEMHSTIRKALNDAARNPAAVDRAMGRIDAAYPTAAKVREMMYMTWNFFSISAPKDGSVGVGENTVHDCIADMVGKLREEIDDKLEDVLKLVARGGKLTQKTYNSAKAVCDRLESLNIFGDQGLATAINRMRNVINQASGYGTDQKDAAGAVLASGLEPIRAELQKSSEDAVKAAAEHMAGKSLRKFAL